MVQICTYRGSRPELARKDSQTCVLPYQSLYRKEMDSRIYTYRSHELDSRHFRRLYTHVLLFVLEVCWGELRCEVERSWRSSA